MKLAHGVAFPLPPRSGGEGAGVGGMPRKGPRKSDVRVPRARQLRHSMTDAERRLWWHLRELKPDAGHFRRQATIGPYFADFACHEAKLVVEVDGSGHMQSDALVRDDVRTRYLEAQGYRILRFWNTDVLTNTEGVTTIIAQALTNGIEDAAPLPATRKRARGEGKERRED